MCAAIPPGTQVLGKGCTEGFSYANHSITMSWAMMTRRNIESG